jgi:antitoxin component of MazEF toxin-antitoxin module
MAGNYSKALTGAESLLLILPKDVSNKLDIADQDWLQYEVRNKELVITKMKNSEEYLQTRT